MPLSTTVLLDDFFKLKQQVEKDTQEQSRIQGACQQVQKQIQDEFNLKGMKEVNAEIANLLKQENELVKRYLDARKAIDHQYGPQLEKS